MGQIALPKLLINPQDYQLFLLGRKLATSRYGNRTGEFQQGRRFEFATNDGSGLSSEIEISGITVKKLRDIDDTEAHLIGDYRKEDAIIDFTAVYTRLGRPVDGDTIITIVYFTGV